MPPPGGLAAAWGPGRGRGRAPARLHDLARDPDRGLRGPDRGLVTRARAGYESPPPPTHPPPPFSHRARAALGSESPPSARPRWRAALRVSGRRRCVRVGAPGPEFRPCVGAPGELAIARAWPRSTRIGGLDSERCTGSPPGRPGPASTGLRLDACRVTRRLPGPRALAEVRVRALPVPAGGGGTRTRDCGGGPAVGNRLGAARDSVARGLAVTVPSEVTVPPGPGRPPGGTGGIHRDPPFPTGELPSRCRPRPRLE